ncbi:helix-turn-helix transcriptional regulator [Thalassospira lucentensis]|uniref:helix-turn-helix transcriptional regulator n=1 Tax=Thalassospira lucentensis TaxID=168935 RepID=UPI002941FD6C|nr:helix-turn-helix transcriptional regulator [Thalassospira lucentensis]WOI08979.1 helix-turn-helix transcriptional regulator [Thalassospira lucentensis]
MSAWQSDYLTLHTRLRQARQAQHLTQAGAGECIGVCEHTYRDFEAGRTDLPAAHVFRLAHVLGIKIIISDGVIADGVD